jgi:hypothetical protein
MHAGGRFLDNIIKVVAMAKEGHSIQTILDYRVNT